MNTRREARNGCTHGEMKSLVKNTPGSTQWLHSRGDEESREENFRGKFFPPEIGPMLGNFNQ